MKLMTLGFDCSIPCLLGKSKRYRLDQEYKDYEIGLFDWCLPRENSPKILRYKLVSYNLKHRYFTVQESFSSRNELWLNVAGIDYVHVPKIGTIEESIDNYIDRLTYLEDKTYKHFEQHRPFIVNLSSKLIYGDHSSYSLKDLEKANGSLLRQFNLICLVDSEYTNLRDKNNIRYIKLDKAINLEYATKHYKNVYQEYLISELNKLEGFYD